MSLIQPVIISVDRNREAVARLVDYCAKLDGTEIKVIHLTPQMDAAFTPKYPGDDNRVKAARAAYSLRVAALEMKGKPFIWMEHDAIPLKKNWVKSISAAYQKCGKPYLLSSDSNPPHDLVGGIGVYGPDTHWMIPTDFRFDGWDRWMISNISPLIARTPIIQHHYGHYYAEGLFIKPPHFPRDATMLRQDAVIFHRDPTHSLLSPNSRTPVPRTYFHSGDLGDVIYQIAIIKALGVGNLMLGQNMGLAKFKTPTRLPMTEDRAAALKPLLHVQPYISGVSHWEGDPRPEWFNLNAWRETYVGNPTPLCPSLQRFPMRYFCVSPQDETTPWLTVPAADAHGIVVARSERYRNDAFPWKAIVNKYRQQMRFVGVHSEYIDFVKNFGVVPFAGTDDLLQLATVINSGKVFIGNQSCPYAIAEGLKKPCVQESWHVEPNCLFQRPTQLAMCEDFNKICGFIDQYL